MHHPLEFNSIRKNFGSFPALKGVSFEIHRGEVVALLGPNGAGKSTLFSLAYGQRSPDGGKVRLFGQDPRRRQARQLLGTAPQNTGFPLLLRVEEVLQLVASHFANPLPLSELLQTMKLEAIRRKSLGALSEGQKRRVALAAAFIGDPKLVLLDEPTTGLDLQSRWRLFDYVRQFVSRGDRAVLFSSHHLEEVEQLASRVIVLKDGECIAEGTVAEIRAQLGLKKVRFSSLRSLDFADDVRVVRSCDTYEVWTANADEFIRHLSQRDPAFTDLEILSPSLEEAFLHMTGMESSCV